MFYSIIVQAQEEQVLLRSFTQLQIDKNARQIDSLEKIAQDLLFSNPDSTFRLAEEIIEASTKINYYKGLARGLTLKANVYSEIRNDYLEALTLLLRAKRIIEAYKLESQVVSLYLNLAWTYFYTANYAEAEDLYNRVLKRLEGAPPNHQYLDAINCLGIIHLEVKHDFPKALEYYQRTLQIADSLDDTIYLGNAWNNLGELFIKKQEYPRALKYLDSAEVVFRKLSDIYGIAIVKYNKGKIHFTQRQITPAKTELTVGLKLAQKIRALELTHKIALLLSEAYELEGNLSEAFRHLKIHSSALDSFMNESKSRELLRIAFKSRIESEEKRFQRVLREQERTTEKLKHQNFFILFANILIVVLGMILIKLRKDNKEKEYINRLLKEKSREVTEINAKLKETNSHLEEKNILLKSKNTQLSAMISEKDNLMGILAHDLRNPLGSILSLAEIIEMDGELNKDQQKFMGFLKNIANNSLRIIQDIAEINQIEAGKFQPKKELINITEFFEAFLPSYIKIAQKKNITISYEPPEEAIIMHADPIILQRIFDNLLSNAIKFSYLNKEVKLKVTDCGILVCFAVIDQGQGFSEEDKKKMFLKFQKLSARPTANESSTGLGLTIVKTLIEKLNGTIYVDSELGKGTEFTICLPKNSATDNQNTPAILSPQE